MKSTLRCFRSACLLLLTASPIAAIAQTNVVTQHNDIGRTGQNLTESILTPATVSGGSFGKLYTANLDGRAFGQPLYLTSVAIGGTNHSVVYMATTHDSVYALDANSRGAVLWQASLLDAAHGAASGAIPDPESDTGCGDVDNSEYGVMGTPVIDPVAGTLYVVSLTYEGSYPVQRLHALDVTTGAEKAGSPVVISASIAGTGVGSSNGVLNFDPKWENQRAGLLLANATVYIGWGSHCDSGPWHGWILGYNATSLKKTFSFMSSPNGSASGVWLSGLGLAADNTVTSTGASSPRMFTATGNGSFDTNGDWGESVLNLNLASGATTVVSDSFTPNTQATLTAQDEDLGAAGPILLPDAAGTTQHPHLAVQLSKAGVMYLLDRDKLGGYNTSADQNLQEITFGSYSYGIWGGPAYFNDNIYFWSADGNMQQYSLTSGVLSASPIAINAVTEVGTGGGYYSGTFLGATPSISANGTSNGIVWVDDAVRDQGNPIQYLYAFDATNVAKTLWSSRQTPARDGAGGSQKFAVPTIADGKVFVAGQDQLNVYGMLPPGFTISALPAALTVVPGTSSSTAISVLPISGFSGAVSYTTSGLPAGVSAGFSSTASGASLTLTATSAAPLTSAPLTFSITGTSGTSSQSLPVSLSVASTVQPVPVNAANYYNVNGIFNAGTAATTGGLDGTGYAYAANLLGTSVSALGVTFSIGPAAAQDAMSSTVVPLTAGNFSTLNLLATGVNGNQSNQTFIVTYTDGTTTVFKQSLSDWGSPQKYTGETVALSMAYRINPSGAQDNNSYNVYAYSFALNAAKIVQSVTLPENRNVVVLAITLSGETITQTAAPPASTPTPGVSLSSVANVYASAKDGTAPGGSGLDGYGYAYSANLLGATVTWSGAAFPIGAAGSPNAVSGGTISLPSGGYAVIDILASGFFGSQTGQKFIVTYTDGTTSTFTQSVSDWGAPQSYAGESNAVTMAYRITPNGTTQSGAWHLYGYSFALNVTKTVKSITLPNNRSVVILGIALKGPVINLSAKANVDDSANDGTAPGSGGLDGSGYAYSGKLLGTSLTWAGVPFPFASAGTLNGVSGGTISLPAGSYTALDLLATGVFGNQTAQKFVVTYTDGTTSTYTQSVSDWGSPQSYSGEANVLNMAYRITPTGTSQAGAWYLYGYSFALNGSKVVQSITLPNTRSVIVAAMAVSGP